MSFVWMYGSLESLGVELPDRMLILCLIFGRAAKLFSKEAVPFYIPSSKVQGFQFLCQHPCQHLLFMVFLSENIYVDIIYIFFFYGLN